MVKIAVDAMGGDHAPEEVIKGALLAQRELDVAITLIGRSSVINQHIDSNLDRISVVHADDIIEMDEAPLQAFRKKKNSSVHVGLKMVKEGKVDAFVSAGNTGALMSCSLLILGRISGIDRPALVTLIPTKKGYTLMLDMGSNLDSKAIHLEQYAMMGHYYSKNVLHVESPRIGLLNIGEEEEKGNQLTLQAYDVLKETPLNFVGNIEGKDILFHKADVVVCDGFVGNVLLKFGEGCVEFILGEIKVGIMSSFVSKVAGVLLKPVFKKIKKKIDYEEYGGAPLLGINGVSVVAHGKSKQKAIFSAIRIAKETVETQVVDKISKALQ